MTNKKARQKLAIRLRREAEAIGVILSPSAAGSLVRAAEMGQPYGKMLTVIEKYGLIDVFDYESYQRGSDTAICFVSVLRTALGKVEIHSV